MDTPGVPVIAVEGVYKRYARLDVLRGVSFVVGSGDLFALLGPNGAGKTTTVKILAGILRADRGAVRLFGEPMGPSRADLKRRIGYLPDDPYLYAKLRGREFIEFVAALYRAPVDGRRYDALARRFELDAAMERPVETYSKGMRQKLLLMSILLRDCDLYILDEPLIGLDPRSISYLKQVLREETARGKSVVLCTHLLDLASSLATRIALIHDGVVRIAGDPAQLRSQAGCPHEATLEEVYLAVVGAAESGGFRAG